MNVIISRPRFSIIIPLESHRGQLEKCLQSWSDNQNFPREQYEIIAAGHRHSLNDDDISDINSKLTAPFDRLLLFDKPHDIDLCALAAKRAGGEILFFTESHCIANPDALAMAERTLLEKPEWAGFSSSLIRITHNPLSVVEADMYETDMEYGLKSHPWRKILDPCFVVRASSYHACGGFQPDFGHFAEWLLAARMHNKGFIIGFTEAVKLSHYYIGDYRELIEFTKDFSWGEMLFISNSENDPCRSYFEESAEWIRRHEWCQSLSKSNILTTGKEIMKSLKEATSTGELVKISVTKISRLFFGIWPEYLRAYLRFQAAVFTLRLNLLFRTKKSRLQSAFRYLIYATVRLERIRFVRQWIKERVDTGQLNLQNI